MDLLSLVAVDDSSGICVANEVVFAGKPAPTRGMHFKMWERAAREGGRIDNTNPGTVINLG